MVLQEKKQKEQQSRKADKNRSKQPVYEEDDKPQELLQKPREYTVQFTFPDPPPLSPPIIGLFGKCEPYPPPLSPPVSLPIVGLFGKCEPYPPPLSPPVSLAAYRRSLR